MFLSDSTTSVAKAIFQIFLLSWNIVIYLLILTLPAQPVVGEQVQISIVSHNLHVFHIAYNRIWTRNVGGQPRRKGHRNSKAAKSLRSKQNGTLLISWDLKLLTKLGCKQGTELWTWMMWEARWGQIEYRAWMVWKSRSKARFPCMQWCCTESLQLQKRFFSEDQHSLARVWEKARNTASINWRGRRDKFFLLHYGRNLVQNGSYSQYKFELLYEADWFL